jgi:hypothetical protein
MFQVLHENKKNGKMRSKKYALVYSIIRFITGKIKKFTPDLSSLTGGNTAGKPAVVRRYPYAGKFPLF